MTWLPKKAILQRLPASKFPPSLWKRTYFFEHDKENTLLRHANKMVHQPFAIVLIHIQNQFAYCVLVHGHCHVTPWLIEFGGAVPSCFTLSCSTLFLWKCPIQNLKTRDYRTSTTHRQSHPHKESKKRRKKRRPLPSCPKHHIILQTGLSVYRQSRRMTLA